MEIYASSNPVNYFALIVAAVSGTAVFIAYVFLLGGWAYRDAETRGKSGWLVSLVVLFGAFPLGLILWILFRPPTKPSDKSKSFNLESFRIQ